MNIEPYRPSERAAWDSFVHANPDAGVGHLSASFALAEIAEHAKNRSLLLLDGGQLSAIMPVLEIQHREHRIVVVRELRCAGPLFRPGVSRSSAHEYLRAMVAHLENLASRVKATRISIAYPASAGGSLAIDRYGYLPVKQFGFRELNSVGQFIDLRQAEDVLFSNLHAKCRNMIRRAQRAGARATGAIGRERWLECHDLNVETLGPDAYSRDAWAAIWDEFIAKEYACAVAAELEGRILSVCVVSLFNRAAYYWLDINRRPRELPGVNNLGLWEAILESKRRDVSWFNVGSLDFSSNQKQRDIAAFKAQFGGRAAYVLGGVHERTLLSHRLLSWTAAGFARAARAARASREGGHP